jgi:hypothetical protein
MMGTGATFSPQGSGKMLVHVSGSVLTNTAAVNMTVGARFGTGAPPANGAAVTGTKFATDMVLRGPAAGAPTGFCLCDVLMLNPSLVYWLDICLLTSVGADTAQAQNVSVTVVDIS